MPQYAKLQLLKLHYREFLRKTAAYQHRSEGGDACAHTYYVERAWSEASFEDSFANLAQQVTTISLSELRASYHARKEHAKERLRRAFDARVSRLGKYLCNGEDVAVNSSTEIVGTSAKHDTELGVASSCRHIPPVTRCGDRPASDQDLQQLYGTNGLLRRTVLYLLGNAARTYMTALNTTRVEGLDSMAAVLNRPAGQALVTVSNHVAALDDPLVVASLLPEDALGRPEDIRWTLCATDRCFRYQALVPVFRAAKVLPIVRGGGLSQPGMAAAEARLAAGDWVHIFPEGTRSSDGVTLGAVRKGVGRLVASVPPDRPPPLVVPFVHRGMEDVMPRGAVLPAVGQQIDVMVGEPIPVADLLTAARAEGWPEDRLHTAVAARVAHGLQDLRRRLDARRAGLPDPGPTAPAAVIPSVSSLDQFDPSDLALAAKLRAENGGGSAGGAPSSAWERLKSRMALQHRSWATQGMGRTGPEAAHPAVLDDGTASKSGDVNASGAGGLAAATSLLQRRPRAGSQSYMQELLGLRMAAGAVESAGTGVSIGRGLGSVGRTGADRWWSRPAGRVGRDTELPALAF